MTRSQIQTKRRNIFTQNRLWRLLLMHGIDSEVYVTSKSTYTNLWKERSLDTLSTGYHLWFNGCLSHNSLEAGKYHSTIVFSCSSPDTCSWHLPEAEYFTRWPYIDQANSPSKKGKLQLVTRINNLRLYLSGLKYHQGLIVSTVKGSFQVLCWMFEWAFHNIGDRNQYHRRHTNPHLLLSPRCS